MLDKIKDKKMQSQLVRSKELWRSAIEEFKKTSPPFIVGVWAGGTYTEIYRCKTKEEAIARIQDYDTFWMDARTITPGGKCIGTFERKGTMAEIPVKLSVEPPPPDDDFAIARFQGDNRDEEQNGS